MMMKRRWNQVKKGNRKTPTIVVGVIVFLLFLFFAVVMIKDVSVIFFILLVDSIIIGNIITAIVLALTLILV